MTFFFIFAAASKLWIRDHPDGTVLVYGVYTAGNHCTVTSHPFPISGHHEVRRGNEC